jgi:hypothetical protein
MVQLKTKISLEDYRRINFLLIYKRPLMVFVTLMGIMNIISFLLYCFGVKAFVSTLEYPLINLLIGAVLTFLVPISIYNNSKKIYNTNKYLQEESEWTIDKIRLSAKGPSYYSEFDWKKIYKIKKLNRWILIYQDKLIVNIIPLDSFSSESDFNSFRELAVKNNLAF